jgi:large subunit ribosomal protein L21
MQYAIIELGGIQQRVSPGDTIRVNRLPVETAKPGEPYEIASVLLVGGGKDVKIGSPTVAGARVKATVLGEVKGKKVIIFKKKKRKQYRRTRGHRQQYTTLKIDEIIGA